LAIAEQTPQVLEDFKVIYPFTPHDVPQEFLMTQFPLASYPVAKTAWFVAVPQFEKTPLLYNDQFEASTHTEVGYVLILLVRVAHVLPVVYPPILYDPVLILHVPSLAVYG